MTRAEQDKINKEYEQQQKAAQAQNMADKCSRVSEYSLDKDNKRVCQARADEWQSKAESLNETVAQLADGGIIEFKKRTSLSINIQLFAKKSEDFATIILPQKEYGKVMHEIATNISDVQKAKKVFKKPIGDYMYTVENNGFGEYRII